MRSFRLSPEAYRRVTLFALLALGFIIVTGGAVRLTGSGLGCSDWPTCESDRLVAPVELHPMVEFVNRTITGLVSAAVILAVLGSLVRVPRRRDLTLLSLGLVAGVIAQIVLGGLTVLFELSPPLVMAHFCVSIVLLADAVVLHHRAGQPEGELQLVVAPRARALSRALLVGVCAVILTGTVVTGSGPHGGDQDVERLSFEVSTVARVHGLTVIVFLSGILALLGIFARTGAPASVHRAAQLLLTVAVAQAAVGYTQYFTGVPELLVGVHILGAVLVFVATVRMHLSLTTPALVPGLPADDSIPDDVHAVTG